MTRAVDPRVTRLEELLADQPTIPLRPDQVREHQEELERVEELVRGPGYGQDKGVALKKARHLRAYLEAQAPKPIEGPKANEVHELAKTVMTEVIQPQLLSKAAMRRNPTGAVGHVLKTEFSRPFKRAVFAWRRAIRGLDARSPEPDPDLTNYERFRPEGEAPNGAATFMPGAQIPGHFGQTPLAKANWPLGEPTADTALKQSERREAASGPAAPAAEVTTTGKRPLTPKQRAALLKAQAARRGAPAPIPATAGVSVQGHARPDDEES